MSNIKNIDWNKLWGEKLQLSRAIKGKKCSDLWKNMDQAASYDNILKKSSGERLKNIMDSIHLNSSSRVLDIGAGPGNITVPMALKSNHVTAIEPSSGMVWHIEKKIKELDVKNITILQKLWEDVDIKGDFSNRFDVVIASFSLGMINIREALEKMNSASCGKVYLFWFSGIPLGEQIYSELWKSLKNKEYPVQPQSDILLNLLDQIGYHPDVTYFKEPVNHNLGTLEDTEIFFRNNLSLSSNKKLDFGKYLKGVLKEENGTYSISGRHEYACISWDATEG